jgi:hypothetical protein
MVPRGSVYNMMWINSKTMQLNQFSKFSVSTIIDKIQMNENIELELFLIKDDENIYGDVFTFLEK